MKSKELMIGSYVTVNEKSPWKELIGKPVRVIGIEERNDKYFPKSDSVIAFRFGHETYSQFNENIDPIPLTDEWFLKFGFVKNEANWWKKQVRVVSTGDYTEFCVYEKLDAFSYQTCMWCNEYIKHVHSLQNIYFSLTGSEL
jgi:hypothetical protein